MKIRTDFVTNSSSSSYILAVKENVNESEIKNLVEEHFGDAIQEMSENYDGLDEEQVENLKSSLAKTIRLTAKNGLKLGEWRIDGGSASSEDSDESYILHICGDFEDGKIKFRSTYL